MIKNRTRNRAAMGAIRAAIKAARGAVDKKAGDSAALVKKAIATIDSAVTKGILKKNTASRYVSRLVPSALPSILSGLRIGWAFAWRTLIAAELVFGATSSQGGLGWYIFQNRNELYTDKVFAGLALVILIGLVVENVVFAAFERLTVRRW